MTMESPGSIEGVPAGDVGVLLRLPPQLKEQLAAWARRERRSLNQHIVRLLELAAERDEREHAAERKP